MARKQSFFERIETGLLILGGFLWTLFCYAFMSAATAALFTAMGVITGVVVGMGGPILGAVVFIVFPILMGILAPSQSSNFDWYSYCNIVSVILHQFTDPGFWTFMLMGGAHAGLYLGLVAGIIAPIVFVARGGLSIPIAYFKNNGFCWKSLTAPFQFVHTLLCKSKEELKQFCDSASPGYATPDLEGLANQTETPEKIIQFDSDVLGTCNFNESHLNAALFQFYEDKPEEISLKMRASPLDQQARQTAKQLLNETSETVGDVIKAQDEQSQLVGKLYNRYILRKR